jgi:hypothetical protein
MSKAPLKKAPIKKAPIKKTVTPVVPVEVIEPVIEVVNPIIPDEVVNPTANQITGAGDVIKFITNAAGVEQCDECKDRQAKLNKLFPFISIAKEMTEEEIKFIKRIKNLTVMGYVDRNYLFQMYNRILKQHMLPCQCPSIVIQLREKMWNVYLANHSTNISEQ